LPTKEKWIFASMEKDVDAIVLMNGTDPNLDNSFFYATGIPNGLFEGCIAIVKPRRTEVLSSELEELSAARSGVKTTVFESDEHRHELLNGRIRGMTKVGVNFREITHANYLKIKKAAKGTKLVDVSSDIERARMIKQPDEIVKIRKACKIGSKAGEAIPDIVSEGMTETEAAAELNRYMMKLGAIGPGFTTIAAFGSKSAEPHYHPGQRRLKRGQLALFDYGANYQRYVSDITRTFICGRPNAKQREMYDTVLEAQLAALDKIREGVKGKSVDLAARRIIDGSRFKGCFIHSTGHGIGISVHDPGSISYARNMTLKRGMVLTVEPGAYVAGFGGVRIEDDILVTKDGCEILTPCTKEFRKI
jgi:Xaa-Pro dipeptidase